MFRPTVTITTGPRRASPASRALKLLFTRVHGHVPARAGIARIKGFETMIMTCGAS